ncbi:MAG TPA: hypothetical protein VJZ27_03525, partial [Aggregatilineales bacterium]|nr:hypothetical protein [Aggregatilineales bacterium]
MMKSYRYSLIVLCVFLLIPVAPVFAQDSNIPPLTETFVSDDGVIRINYPEDWEVLSGDNSGVIFRAEIASSGEPNSSGIAVEGAEGMIVSIEILTETDQTTTAFDLALQNAIDF